MGFMDLSTSVASKKHVDFNDARYQMADKLRQNGRQSVRATFTLYDNRETNKTAINDIATAYALSDKRLPMGELLNKMVDLIVDMEDGVLETQKDASYAWKYSAALLTMYEDKKLKHESLSVFDNGLKNAIINSPLFIERYPGRYTNRTNFFDSKIKTALEEDVISTLKEVAIPKIHEIAIKQSRERAEKHLNPVMDKIVQWALANYGCTADSFYEIKEDENTNLYYSINTVILHLVNGYDMSIVGYVGTDHDDKFSISLFDALNISISKHGEKMSQDELKAMLEEASANAPIDPLVKLCDLEQKKNDVLRQCYDILINTRPMIPANVLEIEAAESVVGKDYIWGCKHFRETHEDLPYDFKLSDLTLPEFVEEDARRAYDALRAKDAELAANQDNDAVNNEEVEAAEPKSEAIDASHQSEVNPLLDITLVEDMFGEEEQQSTMGWNPNSRNNNEHFGSTNRVEVKMPNLPSDIPKGQQLASEHDQYEKCDASMTLLPGVSINQNEEQDEKARSATGEAKPIPVPESPSITWKDSQENVEKKPIEKQKLEQEQEVKHPNLLIDDLDSLFA